MDRRKILLILAAVIAALGTMLVWLYVRGAEDRAQQQYETVEVIVAKQDIAAGESFNAASQAGKFVKKEIPRDNLLSGYQTDLTGLEDLVALAPVYAGEQIIAPKWGGTGDVDVTSEVLAIPEGMLAITVNLTDPQRVAGFVRPGSQVAVFISVEPEKAPLHYSRTLIQRATVLGVGDTSTITSTKAAPDGETTTQVVIPQTLVTLAVTQKEAERITWGTNFGILALGLINDKTELSKTPKVIEPTLVE